MPLTNRRAALAMALAALALPAQAQQLQQNKPIRFIVALSPGGGTDVTARLVAQKMSVSMGMNVLVENKTGGNFIPAGREVLNAPPDGHTLYFISTSSLITQTIHSDYPFDITKFTPVTEAATGPLILVVRNDLGVKTIKDLLDRMKKEPDKIKFGMGGGSGSSLGMATELLKARTGVKITTVPYRGAAEALNNLLGGHIDAMFDAMPVMAVQAKEGKVTPIAVTGDKRSFLLPNVPTMKEAGLDFLINGWYGVLAPPNTPAPIAQKLRDEIAKAVADKSAVDALAKQGMEPRGTQPGEWAKYMNSEKAFYAKVVKDAGLGK
ncbi:MAG: tripartite tricarboxylate transporter substrate binding protein [Alphaproteobacteria bacterium]|nr:tripartite tricarboxylate transporter substrate binding protein [Alphaproteobacteria bacterium]